MNSQKKLTLIALFGGAKAVTTLSETYDSSKYDSSSSSGYGCQRCLRNGWTYAVQDTQTWFSSIATGDAYSGECCETMDSDCVSAYDSSGTNNTASGWSASSSVFSDLDLAIASCPQKDDVCITPGVGLEDQFCSVNSNYCYCDTGTIDFRHPDNVALYGQDTFGSSEDYTTATSSNSYYYTTLSNPYMYCSYYYFSFTWDSSYNDYACYCRGRTIDTIGYEQLVDDTAGTSLDHEIGFTSTWTTQDSCTYKFTQTTSTRAPYFYNPSSYSGNVGTSEMLVHYLEWSSTAISSDTTYTSWPLTSSTVTVLDDQSSNAAGEWPEVTVPLDSSTTQIVPGSFLKDYMTNIQDGLDQISDSQTSDNQYLLIENWNIFQGNFTSYMADPILMFNIAMDNYITNVGGVAGYYYYNYLYYKTLGNWITPVVQWNGLEFGDTTATIGYGQILTAGQLDLTMGSKSYGTLGQGLAADRDAYDDSTYAGVSFGLLDSYAKNMAITFLPVSDNSDSSNTAKARVTAKILNYTNMDGAIDWWDYPYAYIYSEFREDQDTTLADIMQIQGSIYPKHSYASANNIMVTATILTASLMIGAV